MISLPDASGETAGGDTAGRIQLGPFRGEAFDVRVYAGSLTDDEVSLVVIS